MQCDEFEQILEQHDEGALPEHALAHLGSCETCRGLVADFGAIRDLAVELDAEGVVPLERVWISLRNQLEAEHLIHELQPTTQRISAPWWAAFQRPAFAGSFLALLLVAATAVGVRWGTPQPAAREQLALVEETSPVRSADTVFKEEVLTMGNDSIPGLQREDRAVTDSIRRNLQIVDNFIVMCEKDVREQPDNEMAREYLYGAYEQKAELLATATSRSMTGGLQ